MLLRVLVQGQLDRGEGADAERSLLLARVEHFEVGEAQLVLLVLDQVQLLQHDVALFDVNVNRK